MDEQILKELEKMGASPEMIEAWKKAQAPEHELLLLPEVLDSVRVFDAMATQWDRAGERGMKVGLKYSRAPLFMRMLDVPLPNRKAVFADLRVLEAATLEVYDEQREAQA